MESFDAKVFKNGNSMCIYIPKKKGLTIGNVYTFSVLDGQNVYTKVANVIIKDNIYTKPKDIIIKNTDIIIKEKPIWYCHKHKCHSNECECGKWKA